MNWDDICKRIGDLARPFGIYFLSICVGVYLILRGDFNALTAVVGLLAMFIGARSYENVAQTKADAQVQMTTVQVATPNKIVTATKGDASK